MVRVCLLLLALSSAVAHGAARLCPDGVTYGTTTAVVDDCPPWRTGVLIADVTQTGARITGTGDAQTAGSTHYYWASESTHPPGCTALDYAYADLSSPVPATRQAAVRARQGCMDWKTMVAGTGAAAYGSIAVPSAGGFGLDITGLTEGSTYYVQEFHVGGAGGVGKISVLGTHQLVTAERGGGAPEDPGELLVADVGAAPRYVGAGGSNANNGLTHATRKLTPGAYSYVGLPPGTNIGFWNESVFDLPSFTVNYGGLSTDWNIIGSYKLNGNGDPIWTHDRTWGSGTTDAKAIFRGGLTDECIENGTCTFPVTGFPREGYSSQYSGAITLTAAADYTELRNIRLEKGRYGTIVATGGGVQGGLHHLIFDATDLAYNGFQSMISLVDGVTDVVVRNSDAYAANLCESLKARGLSADTSTCDGAGWPGGFVVVTRKSARVLVEYNTIRRVFGEGIDVCYAGQTGGYVIVRNNWVVNSFSDGIYIDGCANNVVENNIVLGGNAQQIGWTNVSPAFTGIHIGGEDPGYADAIGNVVRNNLFVRASGCIEGNMFVGSAAGGLILGAKVYGNTCIAALKREFFLDEQPANVAEWPLINNAVWNETLSAAARCNVTSPADPADNHWNTAPTDPDCIGVGDTTGSLNLTQSAISWWNAIANVNGDEPVTVPTWDDARPLSGSPLKSSGTALTGSILDKDDYGFAWDQIKEVRESTLSAADWECAWCLDATGAARGATPSKGAVQ